MKAPIDKTSIDDLIMIDNFCPNCEQDNIIESLRQVMFEEEVEESFNYYTEKAKLCKFCLATEKADFYKD